MSADRQLRALREFTARLTAHVDLRETFSHAIQAIAEELPFAVAGLYVLDENRDVLRLFAATAAPPDAIWVEIPLAGTATALAFAEGQSIVVDDTAKGTFSMDRALLERGARSHAAFPLLHSGRVIGSLNLASLEVAAFSSLPRWLLDALTSVLALAAQSAVLAEREQAANHALRLHRDLVEELDDYVCMADSTGRLLAVNRKARLDLGWEASDIASMTIWDLHPTEEAAKVDRERWRILESGVSTFEIFMRTKSGKPIPTRGRVTYSPGTGTLQGVFRDISEEKLVQDRLVQVERLRALGEMSSGVAHTFSNLLAVIGTTVQVATRLTDDAAMLAELEAIAQTVRDGGAAVRRIQDFARPRAPELYTDLDLAETLYDVAKVIHELPNRVEIVTDIRDRLRVWGSDAELRDVFLNLAFNALDAMPDGGILTFRALREGPSVVVEVIDNGRGMDDDVRKQLFIPFHSTKGERGSGLGLVLALNVISQHGGTIKVETSPRAGTTVRVRLPRAGRWPAEGAPKVRVLLVEDEPLLRAQLSRELAKHGHDVTGVASPAEALDLLRSEIYSIVFTTLAGDTRGGVGVVARAKATGARAVLLAGWGDEVSEQIVREHEIDAVLRKPFPVAAVLNLIQGLGGD